MKSAQRRLLASCVFLTIILVSFAAFGSTAKSGPIGALTTVAYILGSVGAFVYKTGVGSVKHLATKTFRLRALIVPGVWAALLSLPTVFLILPFLGPPSGRFVTDMLYAYLTTYALIDMSADSYILFVLFQKKFEEAAEKDRRESTPPEDPPPA